MRAFLTSLVFLGAFGLTAIADDKKPDDKKPDEKKPDDKKKDAGKPSDQDWRISYAAYSTVQFGCKLWDEQNYEGCFRLYQGFLVGIMESLEHRPKLIARIRMHLKAADAMDAVNGAMELRKALDAVQLETSGRAVPAAVEKKTLWDRLGGEKGTRMLVKEFLAEVRKDPKIDLSRTGYKFDDKVFEQIEQGLVELVSEIAGGPLKYTGPRITMLVIGTKITDDEYAALYINMYKVINKHNIADAEAKELLDILAKYKTTVVGK